MDEKLLLSICIPIYNRADMFKYSLTAAAEALKGYEEQAEIVVSDNASEEDITTAVESIKALFPKGKIRYSRNSTNIGLAANFHKVVELARGEFCWIVGGDDFITPDGVGNIVKIISEHKDIGFISVHYSHINFSQIIDPSSKDPYHNIPKALSEGHLVKPHIAPHWCGRVSKWDELIDPCFDNVMLGAMMAGIFRKSLWDLVDKSGFKLDAFDRMENIYPHCAVYAKCMPGKPAFYYGKPVIIVGDGAREWAGSNYDEFWTHSVPLIVLRIWADILKAYEEGGMEHRQAEKYRRFISTTIGELFIPFILRRFVFHKPVKHQENIKTGEIFKSMGCYRQFYFGLVKGVARGFIRFLRRDKRNAW